MGVLAHRLDNMRVAAALPGGHLSAKLHGRTDVHLSFAPGMYDRYDESELGRQLASLGRLLWAARMREYFAAVSEAFGETVTREPLPISPRDQEYYSARDELLAEGRSDDGRIHFTVRGMRDWQVRIAPGTLRTLTEAEFVAEIRGAAADLIRDQFEKIRALKVKHYG